MVNLDAELIARIEIGNELGEGVLWDDIAGRFIWIDIQGKTLHFLAVDTGEVETIALPYRAGSLALTDRTDTYLIAFEQGFAAFEVGSGKIDWLARPELAAGVRFNDGRVDPLGRFVAGTMVEDPVAAGGNDRGRLYRLEKRNHWVELLGGIHITNSLCWSPCGTIMYHSDTPSGRLMRYDYSQGTAADAQLVARFDKNALPDGACTDVDGNIWVALWGGSRVACYAPDGRIRNELTLPASQPTCVAFGGPELDCLAVTSAWEGLGDDALSAPPGAGDLFVFRTKGKGRKERRVALAQVLSDGS